MRRVIAILLVIGLSLWAMPIAQAATSVPVGATASVTSELNLTVSINKVDSNDTEEWSDDIWDPTPVTSMSFGELTHTLANGDEAGLLFSRPYYYVALLGGFTSARKYKIRSSCSGLTSGVNTITEGFGLTYIDLDPKQADGVTPINPNPPPAGSVAGTPGPASVINKLIYDSGSSGASRVVAAYYGIPPYKTNGDDPYPGFVPISLDKPAGNYTGTVTFTIVLY